MRILFFICFSLFTWAACEAQDTLILRNGERKGVFQLEKNETSKTLYFVDAGNRFASLEFVSMYEVASIRYADGRMEEMPAPPPSGIRQGRILSQARLKTYGNHFYADGHHVGLKWIKDQQPDNAVLHQEVYQLHRHRRNAIIASVLAADVLGAGALISIVGGSGPFLVQGIVMLSVGIIPLTIALVNHHQKEAHLRKVLALYNAQLSP